MTYAFLDGTHTPVHVDSVLSGRSCGCVCPACGAPLTAVKGAKRRHHFIHTGGGSCRDGCQFSAGLALADVLKDCRTLYLPREEIDFPYSYRYQDYIRDRQAEIQSLRLQYPGFPPEPEISVMAEDMRVHLIMPVRSGMHPRVPDSGPVLEIRLYDEGAVSRQELKEVLEFGGFGHGRRYTDPDSGIRWYRPGRTQAVLDAFYRNGEVLHVSGRQISHCPKRCGAPADADRDCRGCSCCVWHPDFARVLVRDLRDRNCIGLLTDDMLQTMRQSVLCTAANRIEYISDLMTSPELRPPVREDSGPPTSSWDALVAAIRAQYVHGTDADTT